MAPDIRQLRYLVFVAEAGSLTAASRALHITQPALSLALQKLEREVGVKLLTRHARGVELSAAGDAFVAKARDALELIDEATISARYCEGLAASELVIGALPATLSRLPRRLIAAFQHQYPLVRIRVSELSYVTHTQALLTGKVDLAFLWPPYEEPQLDFLELTREGRVLGVAAEHPLAERDTVVLDDILDLQYPGFHPASSGGWFASWFFEEERGSPAATTPDEAVTPFEMAFVVGQGRAIAPAAESFASAFPTGGVRWLPIVDAPPAILALGWHPENHNENARLFVELARAVQGANLGGLALQAGDGLAFNADR